jgi:ribosomal protein L23
MKNSMNPKMVIKKTVVITPSERAAKQGLKAKVKSAFKSEVSKAKMGDVKMPKKMVRGMVKDTRKNFKAAKKEIRGYTDYGM